MLRATRGYLPEDLRANEHENVLDEFIEAGNEEVRPEGQTQRPEQGGLLCLLGGFYNQYFGFLHNSILFGLMALHPLWGVQCLLLCPGKKERKERQKNESFIYST